MGAALIAIRDLAPGASILPIEGRLQSHPTRFSIQLDDGTHIEADNGLSEAAMRVRHPWRYLNHSCDPNARIVGRTVVALRAIRSGEQITFDYTTTEASMAEPFHCHCGAGNCLGLVRGFIHLTAAQQGDRAGRLAPHIAKLHASSPVGSPLPA
jgi:hypothetical protein